MSMTAEFLPPTGHSDRAEELGFPLDTALAEMTDAERANYWRAESKKQQRRLQSALTVLRQTIDEVARA